jgi:AGZA family xanthine/uracil permease-like MFS transporter
VLIIDGKLAKAACFAAAGSVLTFFGLIHAEAIGIMKTPAVAAAYLLVAVFLYALSLKKGVITETEDVPGHAMLQAAE